MNAITRTNLFAIMAALAAVTMGLVYAAPASAYIDMHRSSGDSSTIEVNNDSSASVVNTVNVSADTGDNTANGGNGDSGGSGGDASGSGTNTGGDGGNGGSGGIGGVIGTGDAGAYSSIMNDVNSNTTAINTSCGCDTNSNTNRWDFRTTQSSSRNSIEVNNDGNAEVVNNVGVMADTGGNTANGGNGDNGGNGGDVRGSTQNHTNWFWGQNDWHKGYTTSGSNTGGNGGTGGSGGGDGLIQTGSILSGSDIVNVVNQNMTRITRN